MFDLGGGELLLILLGVLVLFGPKKLPDLAQGLGKGLKQFRKAQQDFTDQVNSALYEEERKERSRSGPKQATRTVARSSEDNRIAPPKQDRHLEEKQVDSPSTGTTEAPSTDAEAEAKPTPPSGTDQSAERHGNADAAGNASQTRDSETERSND
jgi:sec-independent protein translocase protein TatA